MRNLVRIKKSILCFVLSFVIVGTSVAISYQEAKAEAIVAGTIGVTGGVALLSLAALCGVGMELDNNRRFNELSDSEKERIQNGLATNFDDVALQRGAAIEDIHKWVNDLGNGVLDKASECWGIFKDWVKSIDLSLNDTVPDSQGFYKVSQIFPYTCTFNYSGKSYTQTITSNIKPSNGLSQSNVDEMLNRQCQAVSIKLAYVSSYYAYYYVTTYDLANSGMGDYATTTTYSLSCRVDENDVRLSDIYTGSTQIPIKFTDGSVKFVGSNTLQAELNGQIISSIGDSKKIFSTNTDYLERLKGENDDVIDVIDVTDAKNPIVESRLNNLTRIDYNRGGKRPTPDDDDDDKVIMGGLVPTNIYYDALDDYNEGLKNEVVIYDNKINENPEDKGKVFVSPAPIVNVNNFFNTLPCVNVPTTNTVVNNNYTYNNYNNNNTTINELPYNSELIPYLPTMLFENKFPFCIPFDIYTLFSVFYVEREAPEFTFDVPFPSENGLQVKQITLGLKDYEYCALVLRIMWYFLFLLGLMLISRKLIKG